MSFNLFAMNGFDLNNSLIPKDEIKMGGPPRNGIPSIDSPEFVRSSTALKQLPVDAKAIVVESNGLHKAYPLPILNWHEIVNDKIGNIPIAVTYCPLCGTGIVFNSRIADKTHTFGVSGLLYQSDVLLYDRTSSSLWSQLLRKAVTGKYKGANLKIFPSKLVNLRAYIVENPKTVVLSTKTGFNRDYMRSPYGDYSSSDSLYFAVRNLSKEVHIKTWSLLIESSSQRVIVPISRFKNKTGVEKIKIGNADVQVSYNQERSTLNCLSTNVTCISGYYFALKAFYPKALLLK
ncbi:MAG: DUF3179 domain-containing protein [Bdellovibrionales bacterium]|nr:DUF3179 domain-containing protein [Bdellovibrionales bacterium]MBT7767143.1 DUF3179 domain-containing protein [Bdellovibrionales bacterium]